jgi:hypothetical protein
MNIWQIFDSFLLIVEKYSQWSWCPRTGTSWSETWHVSWGPITYGGSLMYNSGLSRSVWAAPSGGERSSPAWSHAENSPKSKNVVAWPADKPLPFLHRSSDSHEICTNATTCRFPRSIKFLYCCPPKWGYSPQSKMDQHAMAYITNKNC